MTRSRFYLSSSGARCARQSAGGAPGPVLALQGPGRPRPPTGSAHARCEARSLLWWVPRFPPPPSSWAWGDPMDATRHRTRKLPGRAAGLRGLSPSQYLKTAPGGRLGEHSSCSRLPQGMHHVRWDGRVPCRAGGPPVLPAGPASLRAVPSHWGPSSLRRIEPSALAHFESLI